jgi:hypothetical protein
MKPARQPSVVGVAAFAENGFRQFGNKTYERKPRNLRFKECVDQHIEDDLLADSGDDNVDVPQGSYRQQPCGLTTAASVELRFDSQYLEGECFANVDEGAGDDSQGSCQGQLCEFCSVSFGPRAINVGVVGIFVKATTDPNKMQIVAALGELGAELAKSLFLRDGSVLYVSGAKQRAIDKAISETEVQNNTPGARSSDVHNSAREGRAFYSRVKRPVYTLTRTMMLLVLLPSMQLADHTGASWSFGGLLKFPKIANVLKDCDWSTVPAQAGVDQCPKVLDDMVSIVSAFLS